MIFKKLFQPKHQHTDPNVRLQALQKLDPSDLKEKSALHELAFNDSNSAVSLAALTKLNNFFLWWKMADIAKDQRVAKHSRQKVEQTLLGQGDIPLNNADKRTFLLECNNVSLLETVLSQGGIDETDIELMLKIVNKINKPQLKHRLLCEEGNLELQKSLFNEVSEEADVAKVAKKARNAEIRTMAEQRLEEIQQSKAKPLQISKDVKLILSKLLALVDGSDYAKFSAQKDELIKSYDALAEDFGVLADDTATEFQDKFEGILAKLESKAAQLRGIWEEQQAVEKTSAALQKAQETTQNVLSKVHDALNQDAAAITLGQLESFNQGIEQAQQSLQDLLKEPLTNGERAGIESLINRLLSSQTSLDSLPALQTALSQANTLIEQFKELAVPSDASQIEAAQLYLSDLQSQWQQLKEPYKHIWPSVIEARWHDHKKIWQDAIHQIRNNLNEQIKVCRNKINFIKSQIDQGRYKNAIRHYEKLSKMFSELPEANRQKITTQFDKIKDQIENLKDWQAYIAQPRKPELLREIEQLALHPLDAEQQAERVKELRSQWNSLGKVDSEADSAMNTAFDLACEEAFKPCREFYSAQETQRKDNLSKKEALLEQLKRVSDSKVSVAELAKYYQEMQQNWKKVGEVDFKVLSELNDKYQAIVQPIKAKTNAFYQENAERKSEIVAKAKALLEIEDWRDATEQAKALQAKWRDIEFAGQRQDRKLWSEFRRVNDQIFAKRETALNQQREAQESELKIIDEKIAQLDSQLQHSGSKQEIETLRKEEAAKLQKELQELPKSAGKSQIKALNELIKAADEKLLYLDDYQRTAEYEAIFNALRAWSVSVPESVSELSNYWRQAFQTVIMDDEAQLDRRQLVVAMELQADIDSPAKDEAIRKEIQLQFMASKLEHGEVQDLDELLQSWISQGPLSKSDVTLLKRVEKVFKAS